ncbi:MAG: DUF4886 domain-containing protein [bacterium]
MMLRLVVGMMVCGGVVLAETETQPKRVLFIGNSYTYVNNLPALFTNMVTSAGGKVLLVKSHTPGGCTLIKHSKDPKALALIDEGNWDMVVLQGNSQEAARSEESDATRDDFLMGGTNLGKRIREKSPHARIILYQTWARHSDFWKASDKDSGVGSSPEEMQKRTHKWYAKLASGMPGGAMVAPVGDAWAISYTKNPELRLHAKDNSHPALAGSYLAGLVLYRTIYTGKPLSAIRFKGSLADKDVAALKAISEHLNTP